MENHSINNIILFEERFCQVQEREHWGLCAARHCFRHPFSTQGRRDRSVSAHHAQLRPSKSGHSLNPIIRALGEKSHVPYIGECMQLIYFREYTSACARVCRQFQEGYTRIEQKSSLEKGIDWGRGVFHAPLYTLLPQLNFYHKYDFYH